MSDKDLLLKRLKSAMSANSNDKDVDSMYRFITENIEIVQMPE